MSIIILIIATVADMIYQKPKLIMPLLLPIEFNACRAMIVHGDCSPKTDPLSPLHFPAPFAVHFAPQLTAGKATTKHQWKSQRRNNNNIIVGKWSGKREKQFLGVSVKIAGRRKFCTI